jgi:eukaryotic-like serine/threonine-protein kinase
MTAPAGNISSYRFGPFEAFPQTGELLKEGARVKIQEQPFRLLCFLLQSPGVLVPRESVREHLWPGNTFVEFDASLRVAVGKLREALRDDSENPRYIETIPKKGYRFIAEVAAVSAESKNSEDSPSIPREFDPAPAAVRIATSRRSNTARFSSHVVRIVLIVVIALSTVTFLILRSRTKRTDAAAPEVTRASPPLRKSVAILGFRNLPGRHDDDWISQAFTEMLSTELASGGQVRIVSDEDVARAKREVPIGEQDTLAKSTLQKLATNPGADVVLLGAYTAVPAKDGDHIRLDARLQDTATGETIAETAVSGRESDLFDLASRAGADLRKSLGENSITPQDTALARASLPSNEAAVRFYAEGRAKQEAFDAAGAKDLLLKAVAADPDYPLAHAYLADAWSHLGFQARSIAEAKRSLELSWKLPPEGRLALEGSYRMKLPDWPGAAQSYTELHRMRPDNLDYGLQLATVQYRLNPSAALATLREVRELPPPLRDDPRIDFVESSAQMDYDLAAARAAAQRGIAKAEVRGSPTLAAEGYGLLCQQAGLSGTSAPENIASCEKARRAYVAAGQPDNAARTVNDMAGIYFTQGDLAHAEQMWRQSAAEFREVGDTSGLAATSNNVGDVLLKEGKLQDAERTLMAAKAQYQSIADISGVAGVTTDLALIAKERGDLTGAEEQYSSARALATQVGDKSITAIAIAGTGDIEFERGDFAAARKSYQQSIDLRVQASEKQGAAETQVSLADVSLAEGYPADAEPILRKCRDQFHAETQVEDEMSAGTALAETLLAQAKQADAAAEIALDSALLGKNQNRIARIEFAIASARVSSSSDAWEKSRTQFERLIEEARAGGFFRLELEARLALGECEKKAGRAAAEGDLAALEKTARAKGFDRIARKAAAARG